MGDGLIEYCKATQTAIGLVQAELTRLRAIEAAAQEAMFYYKTYMNDMDRPVINALIAKLEAKP